MYKISVERHFDAAHYLRNYGGKCENLHGHRFKVIATLKTKELDDTGLGYDFTELKRNLDNVLNDFDHKLINEVPPFDVLNASSENIASAIFSRLKDSFPDNVELDSIQVWESPESWITYTPD